MCYLVPFSGPIGFCRTEALGAGERRVRKNGISIFFCLCQEKLLCVSHLCAACGMAARSWDRKDPPGDKTLLKGTVDPDSALLQGPQTTPWGDTPSMLCLTCLCREPSWHSVLP